jgi:hypothetical protein
MFSIDRRWVRALLGLLFSSGSAALPATELLYYTSGSSVLTWDVTTGVHTTVSTYSERLGSIFFDRLGNLYAAPASSSAIIQMTPSGSWSNVATDLYYQPWYIAGSGLGQPFYASRFSSGIITKIQDSGTIPEFVTLPEMILGLTCDTEGNVLATGGKKVYQITPSGSVSVFTDFSNAGDFSDAWPNRRYQASAITCSSTGTLYVAKYGEPGAVYTLDNQGGAHYVGSHRDGLINAQQIAVDEASRVFVLHTWSPFAGYNQISSVSTGDSIGYSGFSVGGIAFKSAAVPEPGTVSMISVSVAAIAISGISRRRGKVSRDEQPID